ncbi:hypothetical protein J7337_013070 [Fusarium musae]|uniref:Uncharacterized protein n=1 Tax=Fusarium musae TaxID=1042133 RepID=A0A9P8IAF4_9HYPO|nr:hypothetical protein J7337_013070 [Fusarium musae]KAG9494841.1 hypothetical protein J7337_013070 [Fusarium musae]
MAINATAVAALRQKDLRKFFTRDTEIDVVDADVFDVVFDHLAHLYQVSPGA